MVLAWGCCCTKCLNVEVLLPDLATLTLDFGMLQVLEVLSCGENAVSLLL